MEELNLTCMKVYGSVVVGALAFLEQRQLRLDIQRVLAGDARQALVATPVGAMAVGADTQVDRLATLQARRIAVD